MNQASRYCTSCGHQLTVGRYCTNCGARVAVADGSAPVADYPTAVRPGPIPPVPDLGEFATPPAPPPPPPGPAPSSARYPLYADSVPRPVPTAAGTPDRRSPVPWLLLVVLALLVVALVGGALLLLAPSGDDPDPGAGDRATRAGGGGDAVGAPRPIVPAEVDVPETAPPSRDESGERVTFTAANLLDGDPRTSWRMPGNGTGAVITFTFDEPVTLTEVGLVNGYAKTDPPHDWYTGNRRIAEVAWVLDDGTEVVQPLGDDRDLQTVAVTAGPTTAVEVRLLDVTEPGEGPDARDYTAISEVAFVGR